MQFHLKLERNIFLNVHLKNDFYKTWIWLNPPVFYSSWHMRLLFSVGLWGIIFVNVTKFTGSVSNVISCFISRIFHRHDSRILLPVNTHQLSKGRSIKYRTSVAALYILSISTITLAHNTEEGSVGSYLWIRISWKFVLGSLGLASKQPLKMSGQKRQYSLPGDQGAASCRTRATLFVLCGLLINLFITVVFVKWSCIWNLCNLFDGIMEWEWSLPENPYIYIWILIFSFILGLGLSNNQIVA